MLRSSKVKFKIARVKAEFATRLIHQRDEIGPRTPGGIALNKQICSLVKPGYYAHFKSSKKDPKFYRVYEAGQHVNYKLYSHAYQVRYAAQYAPHKGEIAYRELLGNDGFLTPIARDGYIGPRFVYVGKKLPARAKKKNSA